MTESTIGRNIATLRKEKQVTQEALANALNISTQAISKWENNNGSPDSATLPYIADFFGVSIDYLYGRKSFDNSNFKENLVEYLMSFPVNERIKKAFELHITMPFSFVDIPETEDFNLPDVFEMLRDINFEDVLNKNGASSQIINEHGLSFSSHNPELPFAVLMPEPEIGWAEKLHFTQELGDLFTMLADPNNLKAMILLYSRQCKPFTTKLFENELEISPNTAAEIIKTFLDYEMLTAKELDLDDEITVFYEFTPNICFIPLLTLALQFIKKSKVFFFSFLDRDKTPYITRREQQQ